MSALPRLRERAARNGGAPEPASGSAGPGRCLRRAHRPGAFLRPPLPPRSRPGPAMRPLLILLILLLPLGRAAAPGPANSTEAPRAASGNGTRPSPETRRPPGPGLLAGSGLPVLRRAVYVLSALSALAALYFVLRAFRLKKPQKKYGLLSSHDENIELGSLDSDEDTVFETRNLRR